MPNAGGLSQAFAALQAGFQGGDEVGSFRDVVSKSLQAADVAPGSAEELLLNSVRSAASAKALQLTDEQNLAINALVSRPAGSIAQGATQAAALLKGIEEKSGEQFAGKGIVEIVKAIDAQAKSRAELQRFIGGSSEAVSAFRALQGNLPQLESLVDKIETAPIRDVAGTSLRLNQDDPSLNILRRERQEMATNVLQKEIEGLMHSAIDNIVTQRENLERRRNPGLVTEGAIVAGRLNESLAPYIGFQTTAETLETQIGDEGAYTSRRDREQAEILLAIYAQMQSINHNTAESARRIPTVPTGPQER